MDTSIALFLGAGGWIIISQILDYNNGVIRFHGSYAQGSGREYTFVAYADEIKIVHSHV